MHAFAGPSRFQYEIQLKKSPQSWEFQGTSIMPWHHAVLAASPCLAASTACYNEKASRVGRWRINALQAAYQLRYENTECVLSV
jgi:hypothetical protein